MGWKNHPTRSPLFKAADAQHVLCGLRLGILRDIRKLIRRSNAIIGVTILLSSGLHWIFYTRRKAIEITIFVMPCYDIFPEWSAFNKTVDSKFHYNFQLWLRLSSCRFQARFSEAWTRIKIIISLSSKAHKRPLHMQLYEWEGRYRVNIYGIQQYIVVLIKAQAHTFWTPEFAI